jgi:hypothetical protein
MGHMKISDGKVTYHSGNSWNTILDEIADIKMAMKPVYSTFSQAHAAHNIIPHRPFSFPFFAVSNPSISELLALLPSQADIEMLLRRYLTMMHSMCPCLHKPTFLKDFEEFQKAPESADPIFLATLFAVLASGISIYMDDDGPIKNILLQKGVQSKKEMSIIWRDASMQAFCLGGFLTNTSLANLQVYPLSPSRHDSIGTRDIIYIRD